MDGVPVYVVRRACTDNPHSYAERTDFDVVYVGFDFSEALRIFQGGDESRRKDLTFKLREWRDGKPHAIEQTNRL